MEGFEATDTNGGTKETRTMRTRHAIEVNVLRNYDGFNGELVEVVERTPVLRGGRPTCKGRTARVPPWHEISYKGKMRKVFRLPECYGELAGNCITVD